MVDLGNNKTAAASSETISQAVATGGYVTGTDLGRPARPRRCVLFEADTRVQAMR
jgi:hypothetical protein